VGFSTVQRDLGNLPTVGKSRANDLTGDCAIVAGADAACIKVKTYLASLVTAAPFHFVKRSSRE
jgi:hypothetical protein